MSSELRLKKLRGSGGYIMAKVTDTQQMKGNLGGPDLFLAPVGRIESEKITKYFCNTCEKEFESSPKIDYESPNEQVADNLVLMERGQYMCNTCNSSIAEYREFKKTDEGEDVGMAKPMQGQDVPVHTSPPTPEPAQVSQPTPEPAQVSPPTPEPQQPQATTATTADSSINSITGMAVFDENAKKLGTAKQVGVDASQTVVLIMTQDDGTQITVPWTKVKTVGEIILLGDPDVAAQQQQPAAAATESRKCSSCGFSNKNDAKFCEECGNNLA